MRLLQWLFKKTDDSKNKVDDSNKDVLSSVGEASWQELDGYIPAQSQEYQIVSLIASAIATGDNPERQFVVKKILKRNPEVLQVSLIASSLVQTTDPNAQVIIKKISKKLH
ncbi:hypothetical protein [Enterococcus columbae]|uniref:Uncharacterized protein n=1 Tax=Enterococcus columbae DSM 7374 = ATCC 51263 TaxID=1121865 RepID=S0K1V8_9ENTE|nr:hypothetical protein [Enterococcus columbae]EOT38492.1 hypothetical protein OMW_02132 [Enterococcus columbae DSM 7374 = ATCC 51263]EOW87857.1 hypothetical protein I568_00143 [Enterococcus columbae DSM 7374 = ATCC 51263]OJG22964.1 hypothetical protein RR47_GL000680 [Enterococcus columbae DSM 7374 = ATCC 51263]